MFWVNDPSTDTPISADNISRPERYLSATAGANGDFYVTIPNGVNVAAQDIVRISFPAATNGASNARLSLNGSGGTFRNIVWSTTRIASEVQSKQLMFRYDGTNFVPLETQLFPIPFTATVTSGSGSFTTVSLSGSYIRVGRIVELQCLITITALGTAAGAMIFTLPVTPSHDCAGVVRDSANIQGIAYAVAGSATMRLYKYDGNSYGVNARTYILSTTYFVA